MRCWDAIIAAMAIGEFPAEFEPPISERRERQIERQLPIGRNRRLDPSSSANLR